MTAHAIDRRARPDRDPRLRSTEQLVAGERDEIGSVGDVAGFSGYGPNSTWHFYPTGTP